MIDIVRGLSQIVEEGVENDDNVGPGNRGRLLELQCMWVELSMKRNERAYIVPDDTIFNAPLGNSLRLRHSLVSIILSVTPDCSLDLQFIVVQFTLGTIVDGAWCGWITETFLGAHSSCWKAAGCWHTRRIYIAWTSMAELFSLIPHIWRPPWRRCKR